MAENPNNREYTNGEITVYWKPDLCIHATTCFVKLRKVFDPTKRPWINMKGATSVQIAKVTDMCPTQAIYWKWNKDLTDLEKKKKEQEPQGEEIVPTPVTEISIIENGPAIIKGKFRVTKGAGEILSTADQIALCRCGASKNRPFCDGTHHTIGFKG